MVAESKKILVVEDSRVQSVALAELLLREGVQVLCACDGQSGVSLAQEYLPDAIILDIEMPEMDGFEVCRRLKNEEQTANIPILILTAHAELPVLLQGFDLGALDFIPKDNFSYAVLLETLRQLQILE